MKNLTGQLWLVGVLLAGLSGCASIGPPEAPSLELPKPPSDLKATRKGDRVTLTWTVPARTTERQSVRYLGATRVCRSLSGALKECDVAVGNVAAPAEFEARSASGKKMTANFTDTLPSGIGREHPEDFAGYAVEVLNNAGRAAGISNQVRVALVPTLPPFGGFAAKPVNQGIAVSWECAAVPGTARPAIKYLLRIYRRAESAAVATQIADVDATACATGPAEGGEPSKVNDSFLDQTFEWEKTYFYRGTVVSTIEEAGKPAVEVEGDDTPEVKVFAHDVFPPAVPSGLQAVFSGPGQAAAIDLIWAPVVDTDLAGYNIYRHEDGTAAVKINSELARSSAYRDSQVVAGKTYSYSVSAVDERGNESATSEETSERVP